MADLNGLLPAASVPHAGEAASGPAGGMAMPRRAASRRMTRAERVRDVREAIFRAAARVVGEHGYAESSVTRITALAGIAQGTFYLYFESRQALFDELLAHEGRDLLLAMGQAVKGATTFYEVEERGYRAFFEYMRAHPWMFRVLNEAEVAAPVAFNRYLSRMTASYAASLGRSVARGEIRRFGGEELVALAHMLITARTSLYRHFVKSAKISTHVIDTAVGAYMKLVTGGIN